MVADARLRDPAISASNSWFGYDPNLSYLRKSWRAASRLHPNVVMFLGDTFASSRYVTSEAECVFLCPSGRVHRLLEDDTNPMTSSYDQYNRAFEATFPQDALVPLYLIPGNNDIGCVSVPLDESGFKSVFTGSATPRLFPRTLASSSRNVSGP